MAWNQPNGGKNENPWGRRPGQGGSDLDERLKNWQRKLESLFRPGAGGTEGGPGSQPGSFVPVTMFAVVLAIWLMSGVYQVGQAERGVVQRFGALTGVQTGGLHWHLPVADRDRHQGQHVERQFESTSSPACSPRT